MRHAISWFELPVTDLGRAATFYGAILGSKLGEVTRAEDRLYVMFPAEEGVGGALVQGEGYVPSPNGCLPFLNAGDSLEPVVGRVQEAGGRVLEARREMGDWGVAAFIEDSEGNKVALHAAS
jgi:uncharacterized protein